MSEEITETLDAVLVGRLRREYLLPYNHPPRLNTLGGNLSYAAAAFAMWGGKAGLLTRVDKTFPLGWLELFGERGFDLEGVRLSEEKIDERLFVAYTDAHLPQYENPVTWFAERQLSFPRELLGYDPGPTRLCSKTENRPYSLRISDAPKAYLDLSAAHICPIDFVSHKMLPSLLKAGMIQTLSMRAAPCYMDPSYFGEMRGLLSDLTVFMLTEGKVRNCSRTKCGSVGNRGRAGFAWTRICDYGTSKMGRVWFLTDLKTAVGCANIWGEYGGSNRNERRF